VKWLFPNFFERQRASSASQESASGRRGIRGNTSTVFSKPMEQLPICSKKHPEIDDPMLVIDGVGVLKIAD
jgi:hypothetical protein